MKKLLLVLAMAVLFPVGTAMADPTGDIKKAAEFVKSGNRAAAVPLLESIIADENATASVKAQAYFIFAAAESDPAAQIPYLDKAIAADPVFSRGHERKTVRLFEMGKYAEAAEAAVAALAVQPGKKEMLQYKAYGYYNAGDYQRAAEAFSDCLQADNRNGNLYLLRGHCYLLSRQQDKALADFSTANRYAAQLNAQEQSDLQYYWGMAYLDMERFDLATGSFKKALGMSPTPERKTDLERLLAETADKKATHIAMTQTRKDLERAKLESRRNPRAVAGILQKIVENPLVTNDLKAQAFLYLTYTTKTIEESLAYADKAVALAPLPEAFYRQGAARFYLGDSRGALDSLNRSLELDPNYGAAYYYIGMSYLDLNNGTAAEKSFNKAMESSPDQFGPIVYIPRARAKFINGNVDGAKADMDAIRQNPSKYFKEKGQAEYYYVLGLIAQHDKKYQDALKYYDRAFREDSSGLKGKDLQKRIGQLKSLQRWSEKR